MTGVGGSGVVVGGVVRGGVVGGGVVGGGGVVVGGGRDVNWKKQQQTCSFELIYILLLKSLPTYQHL